MGRFDDLTSDERDLLLKVLADHLEASSPDDLAQELLDEIKPPSWKVLFGPALQEARERAGYGSASEFAKKLGLEPNIYRYYERGGEPSFDTLGRICAELGCTPNDLFGVDQQAAGTTPHEEIANKKAASEDVRSLAHRPQRGRAVACAPH
jgi:transcriptional regulator with XRE-family HTH domain